MIAQIACETGCAPGDLLAAPSDIIEAMTAYLRHRAETERKENERAHRNARKRR